MDFNCEQINVATLRPDKGHSLIVFPDSYIVLDLETTGLDPAYDDIIEIGAIRISDGNIVDEFQTFVKPYSDFLIPDFISELTGITDADLVDAPALSDIESNLRKFVGDHLIVGHNVNFDINFLYDALPDGFKNDFVDTMRMSRRLHPEESHHRLKDLVKRYGLKNRRMHRALDDCILTFECYRSLCAEILDSYHSFDEFLDHLKKSRRTKIDYSALAPESVEIDADNPLFGRNIVFTGKLDKMLRKDAAQLATNFGAICQAGVTSDTNFLVLGNNDYCSSIKDGKSSKQKKAEKLIAKGQDLEIITENVFYEMIGLS